MFAPKKQLKSHSLDQAYQKLKKYHLSDSLHLIGQVNLVFRAGLHIWPDGAPQNIVDWVKGFENNVGMKLQVVANSSRLARFLLLCGANDYRSEVLKLEDGSYSAALDIVGSIYDAPLEEELLEKASHIAANILGRMSWQFQLQENLLDHSGRGYLLFVDIPPTLKGKYDIAAKMREYYGLDPFSFLATGLTLWIKCDGAMGYNLEIEIARLEGAVDRESQLQFLKVSSGTPEDYRRAIRGEDWKTVNKRMDIYFLDAFSRFPAIRVANSFKGIPDDFVVPQPKYLIDRAVSGMFHLLSDKEQAIGKSMGKAYQNPFRVYFGEVYREYVRMHLAQGNNGILVDLDDDYVQPEGLLKPDFALVYDDVCLLFEVKTTVLTLEARTFFDEEKMQKEIEKGSFYKAVRQLDDLRSRILSSQTRDDRFKGVTDVICVLVSYEDIYVLNPYLLPMLEKYYGEKVAGFQLASCLDIEKMGCVIAEDKPLGKLMQEKLAAEVLKYYPLMQFLGDHIDNRNELLHHSFTQLINRLVNNTYAGQID